MRRALAALLLGLAGCVATPAGNAAQDADTAPPAAGGAMAPGAALEADPAAVGMDAAMLARLDAVIDSSLAAGAAPGAALAIARHGRLVRLRGYGTLDGPGSEPATPTTIWDLASLTKVVGTTTAVIRLVEAGELSLDDRVVEHLPWWAAGDPRKEAVTVRQLLLHRAGLPAFRRWFVEMEGRDAYRRAIAMEPLEGPVGEATVYSDIGVITLALIVEEVTGERLDRHLERTVFGPLGMADTGFLPDPGELGRIAPTEIDPRRGGKLHGVVHDENADAFGGVAGHAGLFSTTADLARFSQVMLDHGFAAGCGPEAPAGTICPGGEGDGFQLLDSATVATFVRRFDDAASRGLGWDTPSGRSSAGDWFSAASFGHTGYTGTSIWIDPERDLLVVLLTNRVNPTRENSLHVPLRRAVHDLAVRAITDMEILPREGTEAAESRGGREAGR